MECLGIAVCGDGGERPASDRLSSFTDDVAQGIEALTFGDNIVFITAKCLPDNLTDILVAPILNLIVNE